MDREGMRQECLNNANQTRTSALWRFLSADQKLDCLAAIQLWQENTPVTNAALDRYTELRNNLPRFAKAALGESEKNAFLDLWKVLCKCRSVEGALELLAALVVMALSDHSS